jgi:hypothetical protein
VALNEGKLNDDTAEKRYPPCCQVGAAIAYFRSRGGKLQKGDEMIGNTQSRPRKFLTGCLALGALVGVYCLATVGVSSLLMTATDTSAQAKGGHGHGGHGHGGGWHGGHGGGHFWHGRWWGPGSGPCWRWTPVGYIWIC